jgi:precorrin-6B C5,15-methyltransferase / cobalt-precorrin-6B C5,C15-methyltransferase
MSNVDSSDADVVTVVGVGADGWAGLGEPAREAIAAADVLFGSERQLGLIPPADQSRVPWPAHLTAALPDLLDLHSGRVRCVLASGDPMFYGIGATLIRLLGVDRVRVLPHPSSVSLACARLGWPVQETAVISAVGRPLARLNRELAPGRRLLVLSADAATPADVAALLVERGYGGSALVVLEELGGPGERRHTGTAAGWDAAVGPLNVVAVSCAADGPALATLAGLPDEAYEHDGQLTKREVRAVTLAALAPVPGELLWDVGAGSGSIAIEWLRAGGTRAIAVERDSTRAARLTANAERLGVPELVTVVGAAPVALAGLDAPDAVFVGGGLTAPGLLAACWAALRPGGRLVANAVTVESERVLAEAYAGYGGELSRIAVSRAAPVGGFTGWRAMMPVTQWTARKELS